MKIFTTAKVFTAMMLYSTAGITTANVINNDIDFSASNQSLFNSPFPSAGFDKEYNLSSADLLGGSLLGFDIPTVAVKATISADSGTVKESTFNGVLSLEYQETQATAGISRLGLTFQGQESYFESIFGIKGEVEAIFTMPDSSSFSLLENLGPMLEPKETYVAALAPQQVEANDDAVGVGPSKEGTISMAGQNFGYKATLGAEIVVNQNTTLSNRVISGTIIARHESLTSIKKTDFSISSNNLSIVEMDLAMDGNWDLSFSDITFSSTMAHVFSVSPTITAGLELTHDLDCGSFDFKCDAQVKLAKTVNEGFSFKEAFGPFLPQKIQASSLFYTANNAFDPFSINVGNSTSNPPTPPVPPVPPVDNNNPTAVSEPSTLAIFALGLMGLASRRFKKQC